MKKILCVFLVLTIAVVFPTHAFAEDESISIDGFLEKYKRADFSEMIDDPEEFINEFNELKNVSSPDFSKWELDEDVHGDSYGLYNLDCVLFNYPVSASAYYIQPDEQESIIIVRLLLDFTLDGDQETFQAANKLCDYMFKTYDDAHEINIDDEESNEKEYRELVLGKDMDKSFSCSWVYPPYPESEEEQKGFSPDLELSISYSYRYWDFLDEGYSSLYITT